MAKKHSRIKPLQSADSAATVRVYSSDVGRLCPGCQQASGQCQCDLERRPAGDGIIRIRYDTKGRKGNGVTLVEGLLYTQAELKQFAKELKNRCGTGGTVKAGIVEIQGDQVARLMPLLQQRGFTVKRVGQ